MATRVVEPDPNSGHVTSLHTSPLSSALEMDTMDKPEIVVGIDFGTTYTGVSWATNAGAKAVRLIRDWPNPMAEGTTRDYHKIPTLISRDSWGREKWGFEADKQQSRRWFKLTLGQDPRHVKLLDETDDEAEGATNRVKEAEELTTAYLKNIWFYTQEHIRRTIGLGWNAIYTTKIVVGVPAIWKQSAKKKVSILASSAGLPGDISVVSEPEAAALAVFRDREDFRDSFEENEVMMVCDAGGGTVDLICYRILTKNPLTVEECTEGTGDICGAAIIDTRFENYVKTIVGEAEYSEIDRVNRLKMIEDFDRMVKRVFDGTDCLAWVALKGVQDNPDVGIVDGRIKITASALRTLFDPVCNQVVALVNEQIRAVRAQNHEVKKVLLVGGFGANKYLHERIQAAEEVRNADISVVQTEHSWSSVCRGATMWGLEHSARQLRRGIPPTVQSRIARYSYGIRVGAPYDKDGNQHSGSPSGFTCPKGTEDHMIWLIKQGDRMEEGIRRDREITKHVAVRWIHVLGPFKYEFKHTLWYCQKHPPPTRFSAHFVNPLCTVTHKVKKGNIVRFAAHREGNLRDVPFTLGIEMGSATLDFFVIYNNGKKEEVARCQAQYLEIGN
ncbi:hypothetical protein MFIFM68171_05764 [Madurella fahalii]|uniref:Actin-like ATPase domain-containing protein n=1 Tax=Madurella fahalii TaxID=1157608 RepID=A0ABQ0GCY8_9PEZI